MNFFFGLCPSTQLFGICRWLRSDRILCHVFTRNETRQDVELTSIEWVNEEKWKIQKEKKKQIMEKLTFTNDLITTCCGIRIHAEFVICQHYFIVNTNTSKFNQRCDVMSIFGLLFFHIEKKNKLANEIETKWERKIKKKKKRIPFSRNNCFRCSLQSRIGTQKKKKKKNKFLVYQSFAFWSRLNCAYFCEYEMEKISRCFGK